MHLKSLFSKKFFPTTKNTSAPYNNQNNNTNLTQIKPKIITKYTPHANYKLYARGPNITILYVKTNIHNYYYLRLIIH